MKDSIKELLELIEKQGYIVTIEEDKIIIIKKEDESEVSDEIVEPMITTFGIGNGTGVNPPPTGEELEH